MLQELPGDIGGLATGCLPINQARVGAVMLTQRFSIADGLSHHQARCGAMSTCGA